MLADPIHISKSWPPVVRALGRYPWRGLPPFSPETTWSEPESSMSTASLLVVVSPGVARETQQRLSTSLRPSMVDAAIDVRGSSTSALAILSRNGRASRCDRSEYCCIIQDPSLDPRLRERDSADHQGEASCDDEAGEQDYSVIGSDMDMCTPSHSNVEDRDKASGSSSMSQAGLETQTVFGTPEPYNRSFLLQVTSLGLPRVMHAGALSSPPLNTHAHICSDSARHLQRSTTTAFVGSALHLFR